ncbi:hypothetical protein ACOME3_002968 [Neoechinorhynchus agilis]
MDNFDRLQTMKLHSIFVGGCEFISDKMFFETGKIAASYESPTLVIIKRDYFRNSLKEFEEVMAFCENDSFEHCALVRQFLSTCSTDGDESKALDTLRDLISQTECIYERSVNYRGQTPLILSIIHQNIEITRFLLELGSGIHNEDDLGLNAMDYAILVHNKKAEFLLEKCGLAPKCPFERKPSARNEIEKTEENRKLRESEFFNQHFEMVTNGDMADLCKMFVRLKQTANAMKSCCDGYSNPCKNEVSVQAQKIANVLCKIRILSFFGTFEESQGKRESVQEISRDKYNSKSSYIIREKDDGSQEDYYGPSFH